MNLQLFSPLGISVLRGKNAHCPGGSNFIVTQILHLHFEATNFKNLRTNTRAQHMKWKVTRVFCDTIGTRLCGVKPCVTLAVFFMHLPLPKKLAAVAHYFILELRRQELESRKQNRTKMMRSHNEPTMMGIHFARHNINQQISNSRPNFRTWQNHAVPLPTHGTTCPFFRLLPLPPCNLSCRK